jgi:hypothetical protein
LIEKLKMDTKYFLLQLCIHFNLMECIRTISNYHHVQVDILKWYFKYHIDAQQVFKHWSDKVGLNKMSGNNFYHSTFD